MDTWVLGSMSVALERSQEYSGAHLQTGRGGTRQPPLHPHLGRTSEVACFEAPVKLLWPNACVGLPVKRQDSKHTAS